MNAILTREVAEAAVFADAAPLFLHLVASRRVKRPDLHVVVCRPNLPPPATYGGWAAVGGILYERSFGDRDHWEYPFDKIARSKAWISVRTGLPSRHVQAFYPHLLQVGDTIYGGSWVGEGLVVAASGVQPHYDEAFCKIVHALCLARCQEIVEQKRWKLSEDGHFLAEAGNLGLLDWKHDDD